MKYAIIKWRIRIRQLLCRHKWQRSRFVALNRTCANWVCQKCDKQLDGELYDIKK